MEINKFNYQLYFMDYYDGNLSPEQTAELLLFLEQHVDLRIEFEEFAGTTAILADSMSFKSKSSLKKKVTATLNISEQTADELLIAELENDLSPEIQSELAVFLKNNPDYHIDRSLFQQTKLKPETILFDSKSALKKTVVIPLWIGKSVAAAAAVILFGIFFLNKQEHYYSPRTIMPQTIAEVVENKETSSSLTFENNAAATISVKNTVETAVFPILETNDSISQKAILAIVILQEDFMADNQKQAEVPRKYLSDEGTKEKITPPDNQAESFKSNVEDHLSPGELIANVIRKKILKKDHDSRQGKQRKRLSPIELADAVVNSANKLLGTNFRMEPKLDKNGDMTAYAITTPSFELSRSIKKK